MSAARLWAGVSLVAVVLIWLVAPGRQLPLYDGVGFPDEPYRWFGSAQGAAQATIAVVTVRLSAGTNAADVQVQTAEQGPQASLWVLPHGLAVTSGAARAVLTVAPVEPPGPLLAGRFYSNVYRVGGQAGARASGLDPRVVPAAAVFLRGPTAVTPGPVLEQWEGSRWVVVPGTQRVGQDIWGAYVTELGDYALVLGAPGAGGPLSGTASPGSGGTLTAPSAAIGGRAAPLPGASSSSHRTLLFGAGALLLAIVVFVGVVRRRRTSPAADAGDPSRIMPRGRAPS